MTTIIKNIKYYVNYKHLCSMWCLQIWHMIHVGVEFDMFAHYVDAPDHRNVDHKLWRSGWT